MDDFEEAFKEQSAHEYAASSAGYEIIATPFKEPSGRGRED